MNVYVLLFVAIFIFVLATKRPSSIPIVLFFHYTNLYFYMANIYLLYKMYLLYKNLMNENRCEIVALFQKRQELTSFEFFFEITRKISF